MKDIRRVIEECVEEIFTSPNRNKAARLVLIEADGYELGSVLQQEVVDRLCRALESAGALLVDGSSPGSAGHVTGAPTGTEIWGVVEIMGHNRFAGRISQSTEFGAPLLRVDVPAFGHPDDPVDGCPGFTKLFGPGAIYSITITDEATARRAAQSVRAQPFAIYLPPPAEPEAMREKPLRAFLEDEENERDRED